MKRSDIHRKIVKRLLLVWVALSIVIGGVVFYLEVRDAEDYVLHLATEAARSFTAADLRRFNHSGDAPRLAMRRKAEAFLERHFIVVKLYDRSRREIAQAAAPGMEAVEAAMKKHRHLFSGVDAQRHNSAFVQQRVWMHVLLPLREDDGTLAGYFEGAYHVDPETLARIRDNLLRTLVLVVLATLAAAVAVYPVILSLNRDVIKASTDLLKGNLELMEALGSAVALRDSDTGAHNYRVTIYAARLAEEVGLAADRMRQLIAGAFLHDVGKIGVSDNILLKPGRHTEEETRRMRAHVPHGVAILGKSQWLQHARDVVECHHERFDGSGYPRGLAGAAIPLSARVFAIVDVFDALVSRRPYKEPLDFDDAMRLLERERGKHFDPALLDAFHRIARRIYRETQEMSDTAMSQTVGALAEKYFL